MIMRNFPPLPLLASQVSSGRFKVSQGERPLSRARAEVSSRLAVQGRSTLEPERAPLSPAPVAFVVVPKPLPTTVVRVEVMSTMMSVSINTIHFKRNG